MTEQNTNANVGLKMKKINANNKANTTNKSDANTGINQEINHKIKNYVKDRASSSVRAVRDSRTEKKNSNKSDYESTRIENKTIRDENSPIYKNDIQKTSNIKQVKINANSKSNIDINKIKSSDYNNFNNNVRNRNYRVVNNTSSLRGYRENRRVVDNRVNNKLIFNKENNRQFSSKNEDRAFRSSVQRNTDIRDIARTNVTFKTRDFGFSTSSNKVKSSVNKTFGIQNNTNIKDISKRKVSFNLDKNHSVLNNKNRTLYRNRENFVIKDPRVIKHKFIINYREKGIQGKSLFVKRSYKIHTTKNILLKRDVRSFQRFPETALSGIRKAKVWRSKQKVVKNNYFYKKKGLLKDVAKIPVSIGLAPYQSLRDDVKAKMRGSEANVVTGDAGNKSASVVANVAKKPLREIKKVYKKANSAHKKRVYLSKKQQNLQRKNLIYTKRKELNRLARDRRGLDRFFYKRRQMKQFRLENRLRFRDRFVDGFNNFFRYRKEGLASIVSAFGGKIKWLVAGSLVIIVLAFVMGIAGVVSSGISTRAYNNYVNKPEILKEQVDYMNELHKPYRNYNKTIRERYPGYEFYFVSNSGVGFNPNELLAFLNIEYGPVDGLTEEIKRDIEYIFSQMYREEISEDVTEDGRRILRAKVIKVKEIRDIALPLLLQRHPDKKNLEDWYNNLIEKNGKNCGSSSVSAGGHIFNEDYVVLQPFGFTAWATGAGASLYAGTGVGHTGIDVQPVNFRDFNAEDVGVHSVTDGVVQFVGSTGIGGNYVTIQMADGKSAYYGHLKNATVSVGDTINKGDKIGNLGATGATNVYHVHFEVQENAPNLATQDSAIYLGRDSFQTGDVIRVSENNDSTINSSGKPCNYGSSELYGSDNIEKAWNFFIDQGFSEEATAGILGNFMQESGMNPDSREGNGIGYGIAQWSFERRDNIENWARENGKDLKALSTQLEYVMIELNSMSFTSNYMRSTDIYNAVDVFQREYEKAGIPHMANRYKYAEDIYKQYKKGN